MHKSSLENMKRFSEQYLSENNTYHILDLGSQEVEGESDGSYRTIFDKENWDYEGADIVPGKNVNIVLRQPYRWKEIKSKTYDCVVCGQMLEHDEFFWLTMLEVRRILKPSGLLCVIAPSGGMEHRYPVDCYRFYPDGLKAAAEYAGLEVIDIYAQWNPEIYPDMDDMWRDCVLICRRPERSFFRELRASLARWLIQKGSYTACRIRYGNDYPGKTTWAFPQPPVFCTLYYDMGSGFSEQDSIHMDIRSGNMFSLTAEVPAKTKALRFDPVEGYRCFVKDLLLSSNGIQFVCRCLNGTTMADGSMAFLDTNDPQLMVDIPEQNQDEANREITVTGTVYVMR